jgi:RecA-family ATPase
VTVAENRDANDVFLEAGSPAIRDALARARSPLPDIPAYEEEAAGDLPPLPGVVTPGSWAKRDAPHRQFLVPGWIIRGAAGLLSGQEGVGKSLLAQQMATCAALGIPFLGLDMARTRSLYLTCEDPADELWRRQEDINRALGITMAELDGNLVLCSLKGEMGNEFGTYDTAGRLTVSPRYSQVEALAVESQVQLVFIDNAAHVFPGNENARHDVAVFLGLLERLSERIDGAVVLLAHPNKQHSQGNKQGNEYSGSTGWSAHVRTRLFLDWADKDADGNFLGDDGRVLRKSKANYGKKGEEICFRWHQWAFVRDDDLPPDTAAELRQVTRANFEADCFMACLRQRNGERRAVSENKASRTFAPKVFATMPEARGCTADQLELAMDRLFRLGAIERGFLWVHKGEGKAAFGIREASGTDPKTDSDDLPMTSPEIPMTSEEDFDYA